MARMTEERFLAVMAEVRAALEARDSMEGTISWCWAEEPGVYNVTGMYRVGNSEGQGGTIIFRADDAAVAPEDPDEQGPTEHLPGALV